MFDATRCSFGDCNKPLHGRGWCVYHYNRWIRTGSPNPPPRRTLWDLIDKDAPSGCWQWLGLRDRDGYGRRGLNGRTRQAHRLVYELVVGPIPEGLTLDHLCRNTSCVNPEHLEPVTRRENLARSTNPAAVAIRFNTCARGHALAGDNLYINPSRPNSRVCRTCNREHHGKRARAKRTA